MMPRTNAMRTIEAEKKLAQRIHFERISMHWSIKELADQMALCGCALPISALYRIENGDRRITVDELVALSSVFGCSVTDLLEVDPLVRAQEELWGLSQFLRISARGIEEQAILPKSVPDSLFRFADQIAALAGGAP